MDPWGCGYLPHSLACKICSGVVRDAVSRERSETSEEWYPGLFWLLHACTHVHISTYRITQKIVPVKGSQLGRAIGEEAKDVDRAGQCGSGVELFISLH